MVEYEIIRKDDKTGGALVRYPNGLLQTLSKSEFLALERSRKVKESKESCSL